MQPNTDRPAYVRFELRPVENRAASIEQGYPVYEDVIYALITPQGSKDQIERIAEDWVKQNDIHVREGRMPEAWSTAYRQAFQAYKEGREMPEDGIPILTWSAVSPAQQKAILGANIRTVEDLANANEAAITHIGTGGRMLKQRAQAFLDTARGDGKIALELEQLRQSNAEMKQALETSVASNLELSRKVEALSTKEAA